MEKDNIIFAITLEGLQNEAIEKIGRKLTEKKIDIAIDGLEWGLLSGIDIVYNTIFDEMI
jgi:hypothetical protein